MRTSVMTAAAGVILFTGQAGWAATYTYSWDGDVLPTAATPAWTAANNADAATGNSDFASTDPSLVNPGFLQLDTTVASQQRYVQSGAAWNSTDAWDIELRLKLISSAHTSGSVMQVIPGNTEKRVIVTLGLNSATASGHTLTAGPNTFDPTAWTVYRVTGEKVGGVWEHNFYINGIQVNASPIGGQNPAAGGYAVLVGDASGSSVGGVSQWDYIHWNDAPTWLMWGVDQDGDWPVGANWTGGAAPSGVDATAFFGSAITASRTVSLAAPQTVGSVYFDNANSYAIGGSGDLTLDVSMGKSAIRVVSGSHTVSVPVALNDDTRITVTPELSTLTLSGPLSAAGKVITKAGVGALQVEHARAAELVIGGGKVNVSAKAVANSDSGTSAVGGLAIAAGAALDLTNNAMVIDYTDTSPQETVRLMLSDGRVKTSLQSSSNSLGYGEASALGFAGGSFAGQSVDADAVLVMFTYGGDSNLDGKVDVGDLGNLASNWQLSAFWSGGDFNYDGTVNVGDLGILATNWQMGVTNPPLGPDSLTEALAALGLGGISIPEPASMALLGIAAAMFLPRRRR